MNKHFLAVAIAVVAMSAVLATAVTTASLGATAAAQTATTLTLSVSKTDVHAGDSMTVTGQLVDANGQGIPDQVIHVKAQVTAMGTTVDRPQNDQTTDAAGNFGGTATVPSSGVPSTVTQATVQLWAVYDGNAQYASSQSPPATFTVYFS